VIQWKSTSWITVNGWVSHSPTALLLYDKSTTNRINGLWAYRYVINETNQNSESYHTDVVTSVSPDTRCTVVWRRYQQLVVFYQRYARNVLYMSAPFPHHYNNSQLTPSQTSKSNVSVLTPCHAVMKLFCNPADRFRLYCRPMQGGPKKTAHGFLRNNFAYSQSFFIIFGTYTLQEICNWVMHS